MTHLPQHIYDATETIDAAIWSSDTFLNIKRWEEMEALLERWKRGLTEMKEISESLLEETATWEKP